MKFIVGGPGSGKTKKMLEIALAYLNDGKSVHIVSCKNSPEEMMHRLRLESAKSGTSYTPQWSNNLTVAHAASLGKISMELIDTNSHVVLVDKTCSFKGSPFDLEVIAAVASKIQPLVYLTVNIKKELKEGIKIIGEDEISEIADVLV